MSGITSDETNEIKVQTGRHVWSVDPKPPSYVTLRHKIADFPPCRVDVIYGCPFKCRSVDDMYD